jgi:hypothetical protein
MMDRLCYKKVGHNNSPDTTKMDKQRILMVSVFFFFTSVQRRKLIRCTEKGP